MLKSSGGVGATLANLINTQHPVSPQLAFSNGSGLGAIPKQNAIVVRPPAAASSGASYGDSAARSQKQEIVRVTQQLLDAISCKDFEAYSRLCDPSMTCFEPETLGNLIEGMDFHKFYFDNAQLAFNPATQPNRGGAMKAHQIHTTLLNPNVHLIGEEGACIAYVRLTQYVDKFGDAKTRQAQETRVWQKRNGRGWICVHVHRSGDPSTSTAGMVGANVFEQQMFR